MPGSPSLGDGSPDDPVLIEAGDCVNFPYTSNILLGVTPQDALKVGCDTTWDFRILNEFDVASVGEYPGDLFFKSAALQRCDRHYTFEIHPTEVSWSENDRRVLCLQESLGLPRSEYWRLDRYITGGMEPGECIRLRGDFFEVVPCDQENERWSFQVVSSFIVDAEGEYPSRSYFEQQAGEQCDSELSDDFLYPTDWHWELGDHSIECVKIHRVGDQSGES